MTINWPALTALVIDDQPLIHQLIRPMLRSVGPVNVLRAMDAREGLDILSSTKVDLALIDYLMLPVDGMKLVRRIRLGEDMASSTMPIIMMTGDATQNTLSAALAAGINGFLCKPFSTKKMITQIERLLSDPVPFVRTPTYFGPDRAEMVRRERTRRMEG
ncbi:MULTISPECIES: response regulator [Nitrospirillum]|uniref:Response regulator receiver domain-containing protein n=1 Tax=Nitrospirillum amazonense TaxID=28077 RepID=A0A560FRN6_9PROT|nr:response regulator [Nitrospirillum amazonense]MEC4591520.1 response regulator [Nitrospirillum amazonense]TWB24243.1 response regulator receiver domain-containing protein [Nitrospirillum amazonense]